MVPTDGATWTRQQPAVTVCIPTYNRRELLSRSLQSVLDQSLEDAEIIISDNASTDDTEEYVRSIGDPRVRYSRLPSNIGLFGNLSRCLSLGTGRYRVMLPDDDSMLPGNLEAKVRFLDANPAPASSTPPSATWTRAPSRSARPRTGPGWRATPWSPGSPSCAARWGSAGSSVSRR